MWKKQNKQQTGNSPKELKTERDVIPNAGQLTGSLVFDEEQLETLLESVLIHIELYLHPKRGMERDGQRQWERAGDNEGGQEKKKRKRGGKCLHEALQVIEEIKHFFYGVKGQKRENKWRAGR